MIALPPGAVLAVFVGVPLLITAAMALFYNIRNLRRSSHERESIYECARCGNIYAFARNRPMDRCPRCNQLNDAVRT